MVITRLEEETATSKEETEKTAEVRIQRLKDKYEAEVREVERSERSTLEKFSNMKVHVTVHAHVHLWWETYMFVYPGMCACHSVKSTSLTINHLWDRVAMKEVAIFHTKYITFDRYMDCLALPQLYYFSSMHPFERSLYMSTVYTPSVDKMMK